MLPTAATLTLNTITTQSLKHFIIPFQQFNRIINVRIETWATQSTLLKIDVNRQIS